MPQPPPAPPSLQELRKEIDAIDAQVHSLLMARGDIIDRLIPVKQTQEVGSAFRPAREADMMRRLVQRHRGILPLDTVESIWRVIISTFTYVQAPFSMHADVSTANPRCGIRRDFISASPCPMFRISAPPPRSRRSPSRRATWRWSPPSRAAPLVDRARGRGRAEDHRPAALRRTRRSSGGIAGIRGVARRRQRDGDRSRDVERTRLRLERRHRPRVVAAGRIVAVPDTAFDGAALLVSVAGPSSSKRSNRR